jgi:hypothetical protein
LQPNEKKNKEGSKIKTITGREERKKQEEREREREAKISNLFIKKFSNYFFNFGVNFKSSKLFPRSTHAYRITY